MTAKDFTLIADVVYSTTVTANLTDTQREDLALNFAGALRRANPRFDVERFLQTATGYWTEGSDSLEGLLNEAHRFNLIP